MRRRTWAENVERLSVIDWSSPMSASTRSKTGSRARAAGTRRPHWCSIASSPSVFSATVLPPVLGPETTSARTPSSGRSIGTAEAGSSSGWRAARSSTSACRLDPAPGPGARQRRPRQRQVELRERGREVVERLALVAHQPRQRPHDPRLLLGLLGRELANPVAGLDQLHRLDEQGLARARAVVHDPGHGRARRRLDGQHRPAAPLGGERLLQVGPEARGQRPQQLRRGAPRRGEAAAHGRELRRGRVEQPAAGVEGALERGLDAARGAGVRRGERRGQARRLLGLGRDRLAGLEPDADGREHLGQRLDLQRGVAGRGLGRRPQVGRPARTADPEVAQAQRLLGLRQAGGHPLRLGRRDELERQVAAARERRQPGQPPADGRQLEQLGASRVHGMGG